MGLAAQRRYIIYFLTSQRGCRENAFFAMHHCLRIAEVQEQVVEHLTAQEGSAFGLTCKAFYESGMNCAWSSVAGLHPFIQCMPQEAWTRDIVPAGSKLEVDRLADRGDLVMVGGSALYRTYPRLESIIVDVASFWSVTRGFSQQLPFSPRPIQGSLRLGKGTHTTLDPATFAGIIYLLFP